MRCPYCGYRESKVVDSRPADEGSSIRRRRECLSCMRRFTTYETVESLPMVVIKKDGSRQSFDRNKVLRGIQRSCEKRPVPVADMERMALEIEQELQNSLEREVSTEVIGEKVENVVNPPHSPMVRNKRRSGFIRLPRSKIPYSRPIARQPSTLTASVPNGNDDPVPPCTQRASRKRAIPPIKLPMPIKRSVLSIRLRSLTWNDKSVCLLPS